MKIRDGKKEGKKGGREGNREEENSKIKSYYVEIWRPSLPEKLEHLVTLVLNSVWKAPARAGWISAFQLTMVPTWQLLSFMFPTSPWWQGTSGVWSPAIHLEPNQPMLAHPVLPCNLAFALDL